MRGRRKTSQRKFPPIRFLIFLICRRGSRREAWKQKKPCSLTSLEQHCVGRLVGFYGHHSLLLRQQLCMRNSLLKLRSSLTWTSLADPHNIRTVVYGHIRTDAHTALINWNNFRACAVVCDFVRLDNSVP